MLLGAELTAPVAPCKLQEFVPGITAMGQALHDRLEVPGPVVGRASPSAEPALDGIASQKKEKSSHGAGAQARPEATCALNIELHVYTYYMCVSAYVYIYMYMYVYLWHCIESLRLRPPTPEAYGKTADFGTLCIPGSSQ